jgi:choline dehydrogenase-like flavoprotein
VAERFDGIVVGAGAAGLTAAAELHRAGRRLLVLEARDRIGGRIFTQKHPELPVPIELGAEFVHGEAPETEKVLEQAGAWACDVAGEHWQTRGRNLRRVDYWTPIDRVLGRISSTKPDRSFAAFLADEPGGRALARARRIARRFVEDFHAADVREIGTRSLHSGGDEPPSASAARIARVVDGQDAIVRWLARGGRAKSS